MDTMFSGRSFSSEKEDNESSLESQPESPTQFGSFNEITKVTSPTSSHRKSRKAAQKTVVVIPIKDSEGARLKGEGVPPPSDSWAWRKYGQKPIKGSPYPRGYYRCSSSKGCPARKQVERSRDDPTMLVVTYSCEHNHPCPVRKNNRRQQNHRDLPTTPEEENPDNTNVNSSPDPDPELEPGQEKPSELFGSGSRSGLPEFDAADEFGWFMDMRTTRPTILESANYGQGYYEHHCNDGEADESMFSDLGELPECTVVLKHCNNINNVGVTQIC